MVYLMVLGTLGLLALTFSALAAYKAKKQESSPKETKTDDKSNNKVYI